MTRRALWVLVSVLLAGPGQADPPEILEVVARQEPAGWRFDVTVRHPDTGWDHYADGWEILGPDGARLGFRELLHPHVDEMPFTRSLSGVQIPAGVLQVRVRPRCNLTGWADDGVVVDLR